MQTRVGTSVVIPGRREAASPESIITALAACRIRGK